jgi:hypothetical protein
MVETKMSVADPAIMPAQRIARSREEAIQAAEAAEKNAARRIFVRSAARLADRA